MASTAVGVTVSHVKAELEGINLKIEASIIVENDVKMDVIVLKVDYVSINKKLEVVKEELAAITRKLDVLDDKLNRKN